jgi:hypothetical protein
MNNPVVRLATATVILVALVSTVGIMKSKPQQKTLKLDKFRLAQESSYGYRPCLDTKSVERMRKAGF